jgi:hypothetical protein
VDLMAFKCRTLKVNNFSACFVFFSHVSRLSSSVTLYVVLLCVIGHLAVDSACS